MVINKRWNLFIFLSLFLIFLCFNIVFPAQCDDYSLYFAAVELPFLNSYFTWNARIGEILFAGYFAKFVFSFYFDVFNASFGVLFVLFGFLLCFGRLVENLKDLVSLGLFVGILLCFCYFGSWFLWGAGSANYMWALTLIFAFCLPYRLFWGNLRDSSFYIFACALSILLSFFAGMASEFLGAVIILALLCSFVYALKFKISLPFWQFLSFLGFLGGWLVLYFAPGSAKRVEVSGDKFVTLGEFLDFSLLDKILRLNEALNHNYSRIFVIFLVIFALFYLFKIGKRLRIYQYFLLLLGLIASCVIVKNVCAAAVFGGILYLLFKLALRDKFYFVFVGLFLSWIFMGLALFGVVDALQGRTSVTRDLVLIALIILMLREFYDRYFKAVLLLCAALLVYGLSFVSYHSYNTRLSDIAINAVILAQKEAGLNDIVVPESLIYKSKKFVDFDGLNKDSNHWLNKAVAKWYGIESIKTQ